MLIKHVQTYIAIHINFKSGYIPCHIKLWPGILIKQPDSFAGSYIDIKTVAPSVVCIDSSHISYKAACMITVYLYTEVCLLMDCSCCHFVEMILGPVKIHEYIYV